MQTFSVYDMHSEINQPNISPVFFDIFNLIDLIGRKYDAC